jgi:GntR family transcriptional regulator/MocR family aminotransferase
VELHVSLVGRTDLTGEIYRQVRSAIVAGQLRSGDALPATRGLARRLGVSRTTVTVAYERLGGEGFVRSRVGAGTFVSDAVPGPATTPERPAGALRPRAVWHRIPAPRGSLARADYEFWTGVPDTTRFPYAAWRRLMAREMRASAVGRGRYGEPAGLSALREAIARHVGTSRGVAAAAENVVITNGTQQALDLVTRVLLEPGDRVAVEDPGYPPPRHLFASLGFDVAGIPVDDEGLVVDALPDGARLVYTTPSHQFPLGVSMSLRRRTALLAWAEHHDAAIVEDDYDSEFRYGERPIEPLHAIDTSSRVVYVGTFSKTMLPSLRLGFVVAPASLSDALRAAKYVTDWSTALPAQRALAHFIDHGLFAGHLHRMRAVYQQRHEVLTSVVDDELADHLRSVPSATGLHISAIAPGHSARTMATVVDEARKAGVAMHPLATFSVDQPALAGLALGYGAIEADCIVEGLRRIKCALAGATPS